jgi:hypothetical protein
MSGVPKISVIPLWAKFAAVAVVIGLLWLSLHLYGARQYDRGVSATDQKWETAAAQLKADAAKSATRADDAAANRLAEQVNQVAADQEKVNEAQRNGTSPLDALFGN